MTAPELLSALQPFLLRVGAKLTVDSPALKRFKRTLINDHTAPELYDTVKAILVVITAVKELRGGEHAAEQLRAELLEPVLEHVTRSAKGDLARREVRAQKAPPANPMAPPTAKGVRPGRKT